MSLPLTCVCLVGATGTGKTAAALALARAINGAVVNLDSRQVYAGLEIVTAQPTPGERARCRHELYGYLPLSEGVRAGAFVETVRATALRVREEGLVPLLVGGTGLYLKSLVEGLAPIPDIDPAIRARVVRDCQAEGSHVLYERLRSLDPDYAAKIHPNDPQRICRALEVVAATGRTLSSWHARTARPRDLRVCTIGVSTDLATLTPRLALRIEMMLRSGALEEVREAYARCPDRKAPGFSGIGCPELLSVLLDGTPLEEAKDLWLRHTRAYAKRQLTWFRKESAIAWHGPRDIAGMIARARLFLGEEDSGSE